jgi:hypothetical protein
LIFDWTLDIFCPKERQKLAPAQTSEIKASMQKRRLRLSPKESQRPEALEPKTCGWRRITLAHTIIPLNHREEHDLTRALNNNSRYDGNEEYIIKMGPTNR